MTRPVVHIEADLPTRELRHGEGFEARITPLSSHVGARRLGYNVTRVPPGKRAFPFHNHHANEEMFFVVEGRGTLRFGPDTHDVRAGDVIACPPGGPDVAHQLVNTGDVPLVYLAVSTMIDTDVFQYPDSGKFGAIGGRQPGMRPGEAPFSGWWDEKSRKEYWDGE